MADHLVQNATAGIGRMLSHLDTIHGDVEEARAFLKLLGWDLPPGLDDIGQTMQHAPAIDRFEAKQKAAQPWLYA